ncbi:unnamed protein product [Lathyrus oleraceus]|uniref:Protein yippee-like n=1 Tax=Pisum sativum TaxID=3888 RepID=A0A9D4Y2W5_PEA|nr:protein yippee-like At3g08990 [Pisum sativum]KAI5429540.1 hypothetical protein KIW84_034212 [Pisum sativum]
MGRLFLIDLERDFYSCKHCQTPFALAEHLISRAFYCPYGQAYRFDKVVNVSFGEREEQIIIPGLCSTTIDIYCVKCGSILGWKYESDHVENQGYRYRLVIARSKILGPGEDPNVPPLEDA